VNQTESLIRIDVEEELQRIIAQLDRLQDQVAAPNLLKNALNATARKVRKQIVKDAKGQYAIKDTGILKDEKQGAPKVLTATAASMSAAVRSRGPMQDIMAFMTRPNQGTGAAAAQVLASGGMKPLEKGNLKAFVTTFASGHTAIVQRDPPKQYGSGRSARAGRYGANADMTRIKKLLSPAVPFMLGNETVRGQAEALAYETLQAEIDKRIAKVLGKA
jgi:hypothetical protein